MTVFVFVTISFIVFRAESLEQAVLIFSRIITNFDLSFVFTKLLVTIAQFSGKTVLIFVLFSIVLMELVQYYQAKRDTFYIFDTYSKFIRYGWYYALTLSIILFGYFGSQSFIYFQF